MYQFDRHCENVSADPNPKIRIYRGFYGSGQTSSKRCETSNFSHMSRSAAYLTIHMLLQLASDEEWFLLGSLAVQENMYVNDILYGRQYHTGSLGEQNSNRSISERF